MLLRKDGSTLSLLVIAMIFAAAVIMSVLLGRSSDN